MNPIVRTGLVVSLVTAVFVRRKSGPDRAAPAG